MIYDLSKISEEWDRCYKGYYYEMAIQEILEDNHIEIEGNPIDFPLWKQCTNTNYDIKVKIDDDLWLRVECKLTLTPFIYHSWFIRDWYERDCDIIVTNDKYHISNRDRNMLYIKGTILLETYELVPFIQTLKGNKSSYVGSSVFDYYYSYNPIPKC